MKVFINSLTGTRMLVADAREAEYLAAGHRRAEPDAPEAPPPTGGDSQAKEAEQKAPSGESAAAEAEGTSNAGGETTKPARSTRPAAKKSTAAQKRKTAARK